MRTQRTLREREDGWAYECLAAKNEALARRRRDFLRRMGLFLLVISALIIGLFMED